MSRHRNMRRVSIGDDDFDENESQSYDDRNSFAVSPATMETYLYKRMESQTLSEFIKSEIPEESDDHSERFEIVNPIKKSAQEEEEMFQMDTQNETKKNNITDKRVEQLKDEFSVDKTPSKKISKVQEGNTSNELNTKSNIKYEKSVSSKENDIKNENIATLNRSFSSDFKRLANPSTPKQSRKQIENIPAPSKPTINLVVIGHVDAGKSTLMGHLLYQLGEVNDKIMHKHKQESQKAGKGSFAFAWILDETDEERSRGVTIDVAQTRFETEKKIVNLLDAPGHKDFIPNMITGASVADCAILVINSTKGEFETGFETGGQTREHSLLIRSLGISQLAIAINKMDTCDWSKERFDDICKRLGIFLKQVGFKESDLVYIPCSGLIGENLTKKSQNSKLCEWYTGGTIVDCINNFLSPERRNDKPLRFCTTDIFKGQSSLVSIAGKIETGIVTVGDKVIVMPSAQNGIVKNISQNDEQPLKGAFAGDSVILSMSNIEISCISVGDIICDTINEPIQYTNTIKGRIIVFNVDIPITKGFPVVFHYKSAHIAANIRRLISQLNKSTGDVIKEKPRFLLNGMSAVVEIQTQKPFCAELFQDFKELGRFMLRSGSATIAAGMITEITPFNQS